jgi:acyl-CoA thioester hydrolase
VSEQGQGSALDPPGGAPLDRHSLGIRVYYEDTDAGGIVYHARYLGMAERARTEALRDAGAPHAELASGHGLVFVVHRVAAEYRRPARLDELLVVETEVTGLWAARVELRQVVRRGRVALAELSVGLACVRVADGRAARIPARWRAVFGSEEASKAGLCPDPPGASRPWTGVT